MNKKVNVIGAGLAGSEAAWQLAERGISVVLYEMRPKKMTPAHHTEMFGELVCSNSLRANNIENAEVMINDLTRYYDETADIILANLPFSPQIDNCHLIKKNMHQDSLFIMTWWNRLPLEQHVFGFEIIEHLKGEEYDGYILKLKQK